jgi:predicted metalloprotease
MDTPVGKHIQRLQGRLEQLNDRMMGGNNTQTDCNRIETEIRATNLALSHFQAALQAEQSLLKSETGETAVRSERVDCH